MAAAASLFATALAAPAALAAPEGFKTRLTSEEALRALRDGNERFARPSGQISAPAAARRRREARALSPRS
jgi:hypothetical protein